MSDVLVGMTRTIVCPRCNGTLPWRYYVTDEAGTVVELRCFCGYGKRLEGE